MTKTLFVLPSDAYYRNHQSHFFTVCIITSDYSKYETYDTTMDNPGKFYLIADLPKDTYRYKFISSYDEFKNWDSTPSDVEIKTIKVDDVKMQTCDICFNKVENIKLNCGHMICQSCLEQIMSKDDAQILYPFCRRLILEKFVVNNDDEEWSEGYFDDVSTWITTNTFILNNSINFYNPNDWGIMV